MSAHKRLKRQRIRMFEENPNCRKCGVEMWLQDPKVKKRLTKDKINTMATIGHKYSRYDERRLMEPHENKQHRLICYRCNQNEEIEETSKIPIEELWRRSGRKPQKLMEISC